MEQFQTPSTSPLGGMPTGMPGLGNMPGVGMPSLGGGQSLAEIRLLRGTLPAGLENLLAEQAQKMDQLMQLCQKLLLELMKGRPLSGIPGIPGMGSSPGGGGSGSPGSGAAGESGGADAQTGAPGQPAVMRQGKRIGASIAGAFDRMVADAKKDGVDLRITSGYRTHAEQQALWNANPNPTMVARPGTSNHESGNAIDFTDTTGAYAWLKANAQKYGLKNYPPEPWHYSTTGS